MTTSNDQVWRTGDKDVSHINTGTEEIYRDILETIEAKINELDADLKTLSLDISGSHFQTAVLVYLG